MTTKLASWGNSVGLRLPKNMISEMGLGAGSEVELTMVSGQLVLKAVRKKLSLKEILSRGKPDVKYSEYWDDIPQGNEIW